MTCRRTTREGKKVGRERRGRVAVPMEEEEEEVEEEGKDATAAPQRSAPVP